jgi:hypothetical protein
MQSASLFYRQRAVMCFHRRRKYPLLSDDWRNEVEDARRFIRASRDDWRQRSEKERLETITQITRTWYALGPRIRTQKMEHDPFLANPERIAAIAQLAFARGKDAALAENDRLGIPSYGAKDGRIFVRKPPPR